MWPAAEAEMKPSSVQVRDLSDQRDASFLPSAEFREQIFNIDHGLFSGTCSPAVCVCTWTRMRGLAGVMYRAHVQLSFLYLLSMRYIMHVISRTKPSPVLCATLKRREWPVDKATTMKCLEI